MRYLRARTTSNWPNGKTSCAPYVNEGVGDQACPIHLYVFKFFNDSSCSADQQVKAVTNSAFMSSAGQAYHFHSFQRMVSGSTHPLGVSFPNNFADEYLGALFKTDDPKGLLVRTYKDYQVPGCLPFASDAGPRLTGAVAGLSSRSPWIW